MLHLFQSASFAVMELNLLHYTFTGDVENDGKVIGGRRVEESDGWSGCNVGGEGGSGGSGGNVGGEGGEEQRVVGEVLVVGVAGDIKIVDNYSQVYLHFFFFIIMCPPSKHFY